MSEKKEEKKLPKKLMDSLTEAYNLNFSKNKTSLTKAETQKIVSFIEGINPNQYESFSEEIKEAHYEFHKNRVLSTLVDNKIFHFNTETHTIVTPSGYVCILKTPLGRTLGKIMSKVGAFAKDPDYYEAGGIILDECTVYMESEIKDNEKEYFSVRMAALGATEIVQSRIKKN